MTWIKGHQDDTKHAQFNTDDADKRQQIIDCTNPHNEHPRALINSQAHALWSSWMVAASQAILIWRSDITLMSCTSTICSNVCSANTRWTIASGTPSTSKSLPNYSTNSHQHNKLPTWKLWKIHLNHPRLSRGMFYSNQAISAWNQSEVNGLTGCGEKFSWLHLWCLVHFSGEVKGSMPKKAGNLLLICTSPIPCSLCGRGRRAIILAIDLKPGTLLRFQLDQFIDWLTLAYSHNQKWPRLRQCHSNQGMVTRALQLDFYGLLIYFLSIKSLAGNKQKKVVLKSLRLNRLLGAFTPFVVHRRLRESCTHRIIRNSCQF